MILGIIPARSGSKGIKHKNIYELCGKPLIEWTIEAAQKSIVDDIAISTDMWFPNHLDYILPRPPQLCGDDVPMLPVVQHAVEMYEAKTKRLVDAVILLQPTSPLRTAEDINKAINLYGAMNSPNPLDMPYGASSLYSGYYIGIKTDKPYDKHNEKHFQRNGAIFITSRELLNKGKLWDDDVIKFTMPYSRSIDVDTLEDMKICEALIKDGVFKWTL